MLYLAFISVPKNVLSLYKEKEKMSAYFAGIFWNFTHGKNYN
jgi:hypothetical protein